MKFDKLLKSKYLYYFTLFFMVVNLLGYVSSGSMKCILLFGVAYYVSHRFTKNRSLNIIAGLFVSNFLFGCGRVQAGYEGLENKADKLATECNNKAKNECGQCKWDEEKKKVHPECG